MNKSLSDQEGSARNSRFAHTEVSIKFPPNGRKHTLNHFEYTVRFFDIKESKDGPIDTYKYKVNVRNDNSAEIIYESSSEDQGEARDLSPQVARYFLNEALKKRPEDHDNGGNKVN